MIQIGVDDPKQNIKECEDESKIADESAKPNSEECVTIVCKLSAIQQAERKGARIPVRGIRGNTQNAVNLYSSGKRIPNRNRQTTLATQQRNDGILNRVLRYFGCGDSSRQLADDSYDPKTRNGFVMSVMMMVLVMFTYTLIFNLYALHTPDVKKFMLKNIFTLTVISVFVFLFIDISFVCMKYARQGPLNFIYLSITVVLVSTVLAVIGESLGTLMLLYVIVAQIATVIVCIILACSNYNFRSHILYIIALSAAFGAIAVSVVIIKLILNTFIGIWWLLWIFIITNIKIVLMVMQLQDILTNKRIKLKKDDYALGAFMVYASVVDIFIKFCIPRYRES